MKAHLYTRFSTDMQSEASVEDQLRTCRAFAQARGWAIAQEHADHGISGAAVGNRPALQAMLGALQAGDVVLVVDLSRLSRSQDLPMILARLRHRGIRVLGVQDGYDSEAPHARMQAGLSGIMSEEFRAMIARRTHSALDMRARAGQATGGKAYDDAAIVREIFARVASGETLKRVVSDLNARAVPSPGAHWKARSNPRGRWLVSTVHEILRNERYIGRVIWNRSQWIKDPDTGKRIRRERPEAEWIIGGCEPIIDRATWDRVQALMDSRQASVKPGRGARYLLSGLLECGLCGANLIVVGGSQHRYACSANHGGGPHACANETTIPRVAAETAILAPVIERLLSPAAVAHGVKMMRAGHAEAARESAARGSPANRELRELERLRRTGLVSAEVLAPAIAEAKRRAAAITSFEPPWPSVQAWRQAATNLREVLQRGDIPPARAALQRVLGRVRCTPQGHYVVAELKARTILIGMATGTGSSVDRIGSGGRI